MTTYEVHCVSCGKAMLFEQPRPMKDPGQLAAFCSPECSAKWFEGLHQDSVQNGAVMYEAECGCLVLVYSVEDGGHTMPWGICELGVQMTPAGVDHRNHLHDDAVEAVRQRN